MTWRRHSLGLCGGGLSTAEKGGRKGRTKKKSVYTGTMVA